MDWWVQWLFFLLVAFITSPSCNCCGCITCPNCTSTQTDTVELVVSGVADGTCSDCENANGTHILTCVGATICRWNGAPITICGENYRYEYNLSATSNTLNLVEMDTGDGIIQWIRHPILTGVAVNKDCANWSALDIPHLSDTGECDGSASTADITSV